MAEENLVEVKNTNDNESKGRKIAKIVFRIFAIVLTILIIAFVIYGLQLGIFQDRTILVDYVSQFGKVAPAVFMLIQIIQIVFPVIPGGITCLAGVLAFGPVKGFIYNYIGISVGSLAAFALSRRYGLRLIKKLFKEETLNKYLGYLGSSTYEKIFFIGILLPIFPDDLLCYISGLSNMTYKRFLIYIFLGKPIILILYSCLVGIL